MQSSPINILGVNFFNGNAQGVIEIINKGALLVVPAAPALSNIKKDISYYEALLTADVAIPDSGYMSLIWNLFHKRKINRMSGFEFLKTFLNDDEVRDTSKILL